MPHHYKSGQVVRIGDRIRYAGEPGKIESVTTDPDGLYETAEQWGPGCMISTGKGRVFLCSTGEAEHLEFVARAAPPRYRSGQVIQRGDRIRYAGEPGEVELVADPNVTDETTAWHLDEFGPGCMITTEKWGAMFLRCTQEQEDLELVARCPPEKSAD
jgi:hypothetical protein